MHEIPSVTQVSITRKHRLPLVVALSLRSLVGGSLVYRAMQCGTVSDVVNNLPIALSLLLQNLMDSPSVDGHEACSFAGISHSQCAAISRSQLDIAFHQSGALQSGTETRANCVWVC